MIGLPTKTASRMSARSIFTLLADLVDQLVDGLAHGLCHALAAIRVHHHIGDAAHQVFAEADLRIGGARGGERAARQSDDQVHGDGGRADVAGDAVGFVLETGIERHQGRRPAMDLIVDCGGDLPVALAQDLLHLAIEIGVDRQVLEAPVGLEGRSRRSRSPSGLCMSGSSTST
jgi:hypothetical protein